MIDFTASKQSWNFIGSGDAPNVKESQTYKRAEPEHKQKQLFVDWKPTLISTFTNPNVLEGLWMKCTMGAMTSYQATRESILTLPS